MSQPDELPLGLEQRMVAYYKQMYLDHLPNPATGKCPTCDRANCEDYRFSKSNVIAAGEMLPEKIWLRTPAPPQ